MAAAKGFQRVADFHDTIGLGCGQCVMALGAPGGAVRQRTAVPIEKVAQPMRQGPACQYALIVARAGFAFRHGYFEQA